MSSLVTDEDAAAMGGDRTEPANRRQIIVR